MPDRKKIGFFVEGHSEVAGIPSFVGKVLGQFNYPIHNAKGIGNIIKNFDREISYLIKSHKPLNIIVTLDVRDAIRQGVCKTCIELKDLINTKIDAFYKTQEGGKLIMPKTITVVVADRTYDAWLCSDTEGLKTCELIDESTVTENHTCVDDEIENPAEWLKSKLKEKANTKNRRHRKRIASSIRPEIGRTCSRSFDKFLREVEKYAA